MLQGEVLILEFRSIDGFSTSAVVIGEITTLAHEIGDDTVESGSFVAVSLFAGAQGTEILSRFWHDIGPQLKRSKSKY